MITAGLLLTGCSTVVMEASLSENPTYYVLSSTKGDVKSIFSTSDEKVTLRVVFKPNFVGTYRTFNVEWVKPGGDVYLSENAKTSWGSNETLLVSMNIAKSEPARMPGQWRVRLRYKDEILTDRPFTIE